jgi:hypothetical protein
VLASELCEVVITALGQRTPGGHEISDRTAESILEATKDGDESLAVSPDDGGYAVDPAVRDIDAV